MPQLDFAAIKAAVSVEKAAQFLGIELKKDGDKYRCDCPACDKDRVLIITPSKGAWYCHNLKKGGDCIYLVAHIRGVKQSEAAKLLQDQFMREPEKPKRQVKTRPARASSSRSKVKQEAVRATEIDEWEAFIL